MTTSEELRHLTDRELLVKMTVEISTLKEHSDTNNGIIASLVQAKDRTYGALAMLAFLMTFGTPLVVWGLNQL